MKGILLFAIFGCQALLSDGQHEAVRTLYFAAGTDDQSIQTFYTSTNSLSGNDPLSMAYRGVATAMYAEVASTVADKLNYFDQGKMLIESAVKADWYNPEIRFLRFSVQSEVPFFLGYTGALSEDAYMVIDALEKSYISVSSEFWKKALTFMLNSDELNDDQEKRIKRVMS